jgi:xylulokinase
MLERYLMHSFGLLCFIITFFVLVVGTSASALVVNHGGDGRFTVSRSPRMYDYNVATQSSVGKQTMDALRQFSPADSAALAPTSTLPKLVSWNIESSLAPTERLVHQADYILYHLCHDLSAPQPIKATFTSDWNNALKLGFDVKTLEYPAWLLKLLDQLKLSQSVLPRVVEPGARLGPVSTSLAARLGLKDKCEVMAGTTDSIAAFLASGCTLSGQAVTSLGSTLAIKMLSDRPVEDSNRGIYSHRIGDQWLVGGASNVGCAVLRQQQFSDEELERLSAQIDPCTDSELEYYPLTKVGERFPENDPLKQPVLTPVPSSRKEYLHAILQAISRIECRGYAALTELGATPPTEIFTAGGGSRNEMWTRMRERILGVKTLKADNIDAAFGAALLAVRLRNKSI